MVKADGKVNFSEGPVAFLSAIDVSGHDLKDLEELLKQTKGKGINEYPHGEMT